MILGLQLVKLLCIEMGKPRKEQVWQMQNQKCNSLLQKENFISLLCRSAREMAEFPSKATDASMVITQRSGSKDPIFYMTLKRKHMWLVISLHNTLFL